MLTIPTHTALILIDIQDGLDDPKLGQRNNPGAEANMARLLERWRALGWPVFHVQHMSVNPGSPLRPELPGNAIKRIVAPQGDEPILHKSVNNAFLGTDLNDRLRVSGSTSVITIGLTTEHCVSTTARMAGDLGYKTYVVTDATACHDRTGFDGAYYPAEVIHMTALVSLQDEFATIVTTEQVLAAV
jgi:nicotinamidase-related amidase